MMNRTTVSVLTVLCVAVALSGAAYAGTVYVEDFGETVPGVSSPLNDVGWMAYGDSDAKPADESKVWWYVKNYGDSDGRYLHSQIEEGHIAFTTEPGPIAVSLLESISFIPSNGSATDVARIVVKVGGNWYATDDTFSSSTGAHVWTDLTTFTWTNSASAWRDLTLIPTIIVDEVPVPGELSVGDITGADLSGTATAFGVYVLDPADWMRFDDFTINDNIPAMPGDANGDDTVDAADAADLAANWQKASGAIWAEGDFNGDGKVNDIDATLMATNWNWTKPASAVPEPATPVLIAIALAFLSLVRISRRK